MNALTRLSSRGQVVIPKQVRVELGWDEGLALGVRRSGDRVILEPVAAERKKISWEEFERAVPRHEGPPATVEEMNEAVEAFWQEKVGRER